MKTGFANPSLFSFFFFTHLNLHWLHNYTLCPFIVELRVNCVKSALQSDPPHPCFPVGLLLRPDWKIKRKCLKCHGSAHIKPRFVTSEYKQRGNQTEDTIKNTIITVYVIYYNIILYTSYSRMLHKVIKMLLLIADQNNRWSAKDVWCRI